MNNIEDLKKFILSTVDVLNIDANTKNQVLSSLNGIENNSMLSQVIPSLSIAAEVIKKLMDGHTISDVELKLKIEYEKKKLSALLAKLPNS